MATSLRTAIILAAASSVAVATGAKASIIHYAPLSSGGISVTNITETNDHDSNTYNYGDPGAPSYYGPGTLTGGGVLGSLNFPIAGTLPFVSSSSGPADSDILGVKLSFDVTSQAPMALVDFVSEVGDYFASGGGTGGDSASILIFGTNGALLASGTGTYTAPPGTTAAIWTDGALASKPGATATAFHVVIDNVLHTAAPAAADFAYIEKKGVTVTLGGGGATPEPASLGVLALGALALINRRRNA